MNELDKKNICVVLLTHDGIDGRLILKALLKGRWKVGGVVYEKRAGTWKTRIKAWIRRLPVRMEAGVVPSRATKNIQDELGFITALKPDLMVVVGTKKLPKSVYGLTRLGAI